MEEMFGLRHSGEIVDDFLFFMLSVGPREEVAKLVFFLPFVPILLFRKSRLEMLITAGCVGLGFAVWENLIYFKQFGSAVAFPRFLTANFFHLALTGLNGLAFCDLLRNPVRGFLPLIGTFVLTVAAHGAYDTLASLEHLRIMMLGAMIIYMLVALWFFRKLRTLRDGSTDQFSIGATFVIGISLLASTILVLASREIGFIPTMVVFAIVGFGMIMVSYMFYWQLGEGMSEEEEAPLTPYYR
jgi:RsiW-degrading membrane proteinase PrsW (M82 family)